MTLKSQILTGCGDLAAVALAGSAGIADFPENVKIQNIFPWAPGTSLRHGEPDDCRRHVRASGPTFCG